MPSSTSSSDHNARPVWPILAVAVAIVAAYQLVVPRVFPDGGRGHDQWQENVIKAQRVVHGHTAPLAVVVGSSKMARVSFAIPAIYNLALNGDGALTGLEVIRRSAIRPRVVVLEIGEVIVREADAAFLDSVLGAVNHRLRSWITVLQDAYQPGVLINHAAQTWAARHAQVADDRVRPELYAQLAAAQVTAHTTPPDPLTLRPILGALRRAIDELRATGVTVVFVEPPEDPVLWHSPASETVRQVLRRAFPDVVWYPEPDPAAYRTTDAVHLDRESATRFAGELTACLAARGLLSGPAGS